MNTISKFFAAILFTAAIGSLASCKKEFDNPPASSDPQIVANKTIAQLKAMHTTYGAYDVITDDIIISGVVIADDKSGNLYKQLFIRDSSGALQILLDAASLYGDYPVGREIFIKCKGLCISDYNRMMQLGIKAQVSGAPSVQGVPSNMITNYVIGGTLNHPAAPKEVSLTDLGNASIDMQNPLLGDLIKLNDFEFVNITNTYSDTSTYKKDQNDTLQNCDGSTLIMRTSGYARFAAKRVPAGHGSIAAIYTVFQSNNTSGTKQLLLRDTTDIKFTEPRCFIFEQSFSTLTPADNGAVFALNGWKNVGETGNVLYKYSVFGTFAPYGTVALVSGFGTGQSTITSWLITPGIKLDAGTTPKLSFKTAYRFANLATLNAYVSTDYAGSDSPSASTWTLLPATIPGNTANNNSSTFSPLTTSGALDLSAYAGQTVYIAFKYEGSDPASGTKKTTTFEIDDIKVSRQ